MDYSSSLQYRALFSWEGLVHLYSIVELDYTAHVRARRTGSGYAPSMHADTLTAIATILGYTLMATTGSAAAVRLLTTTIIWSLDRLAALWSVFRTLANAAIVLGYLAPDDARQLTRAQWAQRLEAAGIKRTSPARKRRTDSQ